jgi:RimJ/RimL family protein N-acetyltransferase
VASEIEFRSAQQGDGRKYCELMNQAGGESPFLAFDQGNFYLDEASAEEVIERFSNRANEAFFVAARDDRLIGICLLESSTFPRLEHQAELRIAVLKEAWGTGVARCLMDMAIDFFMSSDLLTRLSLQVSTRHRRGIEVYRRYQFVEEGIKRRGMRVQGEYHDLLMMARIKDDSQ